MENKKNNKNKIMGVFWMQYLKQLIIKRKNVVYYKEEILEVDEEKTKEYQKPERIFLKKHSSIRKTNLGVISCDTGKAMVINELTKNKIETKKELIATFKENLVSAIANTELKTKELKAILELVKKNGLD